MNNHSEKRKFPRVQAFFRISLSLENDKDRAIALAKDISKGGLYFQTEKLLGPNDIVEVTFSLPGSEKTYTVKGQVIRLVTMDDPDNANKNKYGAGVRFLEIEEEVVEAIKELVEANSNS